ncbi:MAG: DNA repair protein RadC [Methanotrichaceae archaeon]
MIKDKDCQRNKKKYPNAISNWPSGDRPREKLLLKGPDALSDAELLSIFLRMGIKGKNAIDLSRELLSTFGSLRGLYAAPIEELNAVTGLGNAKIAQFKAVLELSKRYLLESIENRPYLECSENIFNLLYQEMRDLDYEVFKVILLNGQNEVLKIVDISHGTLTTSAIYPREVLKLALRYSAASLVFAHNHPSGKALPSNEDKRITRDLVCALRTIGLKVHDHVIIGNNQKFSFADAGQIDQYDVEFDEWSAEWQSKSALI